MDTPIKQCLTCIRSDLKVSSIDDAPYLCISCIPDFKHWEAKQETQPPEEPPVNPLDTQVGGSHYKDMEIQPAEFSVKNKLNPCQANVIKYTSRIKGHNAKVIEDRRKAIHYLQMEIGFIESGDINFE